jgi:membrane protease subunit (stomatin/prohibitin family)
MGELIDREVTLLLINKELKKFGGNWLQDILTKKGLLISKQIVSEQPAVEAKVGHGQWKCICEYEEFNEQMADYLCDGCGYVISRLKNQKPKFCENCGIPMNEDADERI